MQDRVYIMCKKCNEVDNLYCETIFKILRQIALLEEDKYQYGKGWKYFAEFVWDCCNPSLCYEDIEKKYELDKLKKSIV